MLIFQASVLALFTPGFTDAMGGEAPPNVDLIVDGGISLDVLMFRLGLGLGPSLRVSLEQDAVATRLGVNVKATADVMLGGLGVGLTYLNQFEFDLEDASQLLDQDYSKGRFGVSVLLSL